MSATVLVQENAFVVQSGAERIGSRRLLDEAARHALEGFAARCRLLEVRPDRAEALAIGRDLYRWLDGDGGDFTRLLNQAPRPLILTLHCPSYRPSLAEWAMLHAPWELLANEHGYLAADALLQFSPARRLGPAGKVEPLDDLRLGLAFMAGAPEGQKELDFEAEEAAILAAVGDAKLDLLVEDSGQPETLREKLNAIGGMPVLHLSCHGHNAWREVSDAKPRPVLMLEDDAGHPAPTDSTALLNALLPHRPRLLFLSACLSAERGDASGHALPPSAAHKELDGASGSSSGELVHSLSTALVEAGLPAVLGWAGSVADRAATLFATRLYGQLAAQQTLAAAVGQARRELLLSPDPVIQGDWHLARLWLGGTGDAGAALVKGKTKRLLVSNAHGHTEFLDGKRVPVASYEMFVGRRRELQRAVRVLAGNEHAGLLLTGMGRLGKSSLAARIANRRRDLRLVLLHGQFGIEELLERLEEALRNQAAARDLLDAGAARVRAALPQGREAALKPLGHLLADLLAGPCHQSKGQDRPLLLILDDFEQLLEKAPGARPVKPEHAGLIATILSAFQPDDTDSRLLITSRFAFRLSQGGKDLAKRLARIELPSFSNTAERKLTLRQEDAARQQQIPDLRERLARLPAAQACSRGNPGLLDLIGARLLLNPAVPLIRATAALEQMQSYVAGGELPSEPEVLDFLKIIALDALLELAGEAGRGLLRALRLFTLPVPREVIGALTKAVGGDAESLSALGLLEPAMDPVAGNLTAAQVSQLAAGRLEPLDEDTAATIATIAIAPLFSIWGADGRSGAVALELTRLALLAVDEPLAVDALENCAAGGVRALESENLARAAACGKAAIQRLDAAQRPVPSRLLASSARCCRQSGDPAAANALLTRGQTALDASPGDQDPMEVGHLLMERADRLVEQGNLEEALPFYDAAAELARTAGSDVSVAITRGRIADILQARGQLDEALRIRTEDQLPVYERLGDVREKAVTQGKIADILQARGQLDEALRIRTEDELPVYERLGDVRSLLVCRANIAIGLLMRASGPEDAEDIRKANRLLCLALADARRLRIPEQAQIEAIMEQVGLDCDDRS